MDESGVMGAIRVVGCGAGASVAGANAGVDVGGAIDESNVVVAMAGWIDSWSESVSLGNSSIRRCTEVNGVTGGLLMSIELLLITSVRQLVLGVPFIRGEVRFTLEPTVFHGGDSGRGTMRSAEAESSMDAMEASGAGDSMVD